MCVILNIDPGAEIPQDKMELACDINKHGFGLVWFEKDKIKVERDTADNDPKRIAGLLEKLKGTQGRRILHLRHATVGDVSPMNSHPFIGLGGTLGMMHNGTLYRFKPDEKDSKESDSLRFFRDLVEPFATMARKFSGPKFLLENQLWRRMLLEYVTSDNKILLFNNLGETLTFNKHKGKDYKGFWASNEYSFDEWHARNPNKPAWGGGNNSGGPFGGTSSNSRGTNWVGGRPQNANDLPGHEVLIGQSIKAGSASDFFKAAHAILETAKKPSSFNDRQFQCDCVGSWLESITKAGESADSIRRKYFMGIPGVERLEAPRQSFTKLSGIDDITELKTVTETDLANMCENFPQAMAAAFIQLMSTLDFERWVNHKDMKSNVA